MAGGGSIPYESVRLGLPTIASDLNPVAYILLKSTIEYPVKYGQRLLTAVEEICNKIHDSARKELSEFFPKNIGEDVFAYVWSRTVNCPNCSLIIPMSPNWWILRGNEPEKEVAVKLIVPNESDGNTCSFTLVKNPRSNDYNPFQGTDKRKEALCPRCGRIIDGDKVKAIAQSGEMGHQLYAVCTKIKRTGKRRGTWSFRTPRPDEFEVVKKAENRLKNKLPEWKTHGIVPSEDIQLGLKTREPLNFGINRWCDMFNPRQLLTHLTYLEKIQEEKLDLLSLAKTNEEKDFAKAVVTYAGIVFDGCVDYSSLLTRWDPTRIKIANSMSMQAFPFKTSYAEAEPCETLWSWVQSKILKTLTQIVKFLPDNPGEITIFNSDSASIPLGEKSIDCIVVDPPYYANVMYAEVSDFFYVWLKRTVGDLYPEAFKDLLTDKQEEAVANTSLFRDAGKRGVAKQLASQHYEAKMEACFRDMNRVLRDDGVLTVMFTHRESEAWASLATSLINAKFTFTASWPVFTEPSRKFGKVNKGVLKATVLLSCRKRVTEKRGLWEQVINELYSEAEKKVKEHASQGITGPDLLVSLFAPVLGKFADYSIVRDATGNVKSPADALNIVAEVVNKHLTADLPASDLNTLAYLNLIREAPALQAEYDFTRLITMFGGNITVDSLDLKGGSGLIKKKGAKVSILTAHDRVELGIINPNKPESLHTLIDIVHATIIAYEQRGLQAVTNILQQTGRDTADSGYIACLRAITQSGLSQGASDNLKREAGTINSMLEALGHSPEATRKKGESLRDYA